mgnify:CR=1 FL=1
MDRILIVDDEFLIRYTLEEGLKDRGYDAYSAATVEEGLEFVRKYHPGVLLLDNLLENSVGMDEIVNFKNADEELQVIMMTAYGSVSQAVEATKRGAYDYILKPFDVDEIDMLIKRCLEQKRNRDSLVFLKGDVPQFLGVSEAAARIRHLIQVLGENLSVNVLLRGETGTGKEVVARQIHANSARKDNLMVRINCGAIPENLMESELFGYERGAFAGALKTKKGLIELADGGTVFLDEIGDLPLHMQVKLLRVLQQKKVTRVGGTEPIALDVRVIAATNRNLEQMVREGTFREDLYYRLNVVSIFIPPLRERREDIIPLINHFLMVENQKYHTNKSIYSDTIDAFEGYCWPGNVRELENLLENLVITTPGDIIRRENLPLKLRRPQQVSAEEEEETVSLKSVVERAEYAAIERAIEKYGSIRKAAAALDVNPSTITRKMQLYKDMSSRKQNK